MGLMAWGYRLVWVEVGGSCPAAYDVGIERKSG